MPRRWDCSSRRSRAIRITARRWPWRRSATFGSSKTAGPKTGDRPPQRHRSRAAGAAGGGDDPGILANAALVLANFGEDIGAMIGLVDRALALNPSFARGWYISGILRLCAGQPDLAIEHVETSLRLSPRERTGRPLPDRRGAISSNGGSTKRCRSCSCRSKTIRAFPYSYRFLAACYAHMGRLDEAREIVAQLRAITRSCRACCPSALPSTANCCCRACAWRWARRT